MKTSSYDLILAKISEKIDIHTGQKHETTE